MANEVTIIVNARNDTRPIFDQVKADAKAAGTQAGTELSAGMEQGVQKGSAGVEKAGEDAGHEGAKGAGKGITDAGAEVEKAFDKVGRKAGQTGGRHAGDEFVAALPFGIGKAAIAVGQALTNLFAKLGPKVAEDALAVGEKAGKAVGDGLAAAGDSAAQDAASLFTPEGAIGAAIVAAIVLTLAPVIGAVLGAAVFGALGAVFLGIGAYVQRQNPVVVDAFTSLKNDIVSTMKDATAPLVTPFADAMKIIDKMVTQEGPQIRQVFAAMAPAVVPLAQAWSDVARSLTPALVDVARTFGRVFSDPQMLDSIRSFGTYLGQFFETLANNGPLITDTFRAVLAAADEVLVVLNGLIDAAAGIDHAWTAAGNTVDGAIQGWARAFGAGSTATQKMVTGMQFFVGTAAAVSTALTDSQLKALAASVDYAKLAQQLSATAQTADTLAGALTDKVLNSLMSNDLAALHFRESLHRVSDAFKQNGRDISIYTVKGEANRESVLASVQANIDQYNAMIASGDSAVAAAGKYDTNTAALEAQLRKAHLTKDQIAALIGQYEKVPSKVNTIIAMQGLTDAINHLNETIRLVNHLDGLTATSYVNVVTRNLPGGIGHIQARATGGPVSGDTWMNEHGGELVRLPSGSMVYPAGTAPAGTAAASPGHGAPIRVTLDFSGADTNGLGQLVMRMVRDRQIQLRVNGQAVTV